MAFSVLSLCLPYFESLFSVLKESSQFRGIFSFERGIPISANETYVQAPWDESCPLAHLIKSES